MYKKLQCRYCKYWEEPDLYLLSLGIHILQTIFHQTGNCKEITVKESIPNAEDPLHFGYPNRFFAMGSSQTLAYQQEKHCENVCILPMLACLCKGFSFFSSSPATPVHLKEIPSHWSDFSWEPFSRKTLSTYSKPNRKSPGQENMGYPTKSPREESRAFTNWFWTLCRGQCIATQKYFWLLFANKNRFCSMIGGIENKFKEQK